MRLSFGAGELRVDVDDGAGSAAPAAGGAGGGLPGMRERIRAYGGDVQAGPRQPAGWAVSARLPLDNGRNHMIRVLLVDDQSLLRMGFRLILEAEPDMEVVGEAGDGASGVGMASALHPDIVLMDVRMPGMDGIAATASIIAAGPASKVLILTTFDLD